jgi:Flp pilus assembly pilin Flp
LEGRNALNRGEGEPVLRRYCSLLGRLKDESGQTYVEYALMLVAIVGIVLAGWTNLDNAINAAISNVTTAFGA